MTPYVDAAERGRLCDLLDELGPDGPTLLEPWTARDIAAHLILRQHDALAGPGLGRQQAADVEVSGPAAAVDALQRSHLGM